MDCDIDTRIGWPEDLRVLLKVHPRAEWRARGSAMTAFWLEQHDFFRRQCAALRAVADDFRAEAISPTELMSVVAPRLQMFIGHLEGHHQVEDFHYFPAFRAAEQRLAQGFDVLARDHALIHAGLEEIVAATGELVSAVRRGPAADGDARHAGERYVETSERLLRRLLRHLDDEEDLVVPVMLAQRE